MVIGRVEDLVFRANTTEINLCVAVARRVMGPKVLVLDAFRFGILGNGEVIIAAVVGNDDVSGVANNCFR